MAKKHTKNQSTSLSATSFTRKESKQTERNGCHQIKLKRSEYSCTTSSSGISASTSSTSSVVQPRNPFQVAITRVEDHKDSFSLSGHVFPSSTTVTFTSNDPVCQYHYYQTNSNRWVNPNDYKQQTINYWLENVIKNNQTIQLENDDFEKEFNSCDVRDADDVIISADESAVNCMQRTKQRYKPYSACVKRELPIVDQTETSYRQDKIRTLKALIAKHDEHINELNLCAYMEKDCPQESAGKIPLRPAEKGKNFPAHPTPVKPKQSPCKAIKEKKSPTYDFRNPNSIFFAVLEEEQFWHQQHSQQMLPMTRRKRGRSHTEHSWNRCCATATFSEQHDEFRPHVEIGNIPAS